MKHLRYLLRGAVLSILLAPLSLLVDMHAGEKIASGAHVPYMMALKSKKDTDHKKFVLVLQKNRRCFRVTKCALHIKLEPVTPQEQQRSLQQQSGWRVARLKDIPMDDALRALVKKRMIALGMAEVESLLYNPCCSERYRALVPLFSKRGFEKAFFVTQDPDDTIEIVSNIPLIEMVQDAEVL